MTKTIFNFPLGFFGFCSGWNEGFEPDGRYSITQRMPVNLRSIPASYTSILDSPVEVPKLFLKNKRKADYIGLSSGAGSSLFEFNGEVYKIKRNGFLDDKFVHEPFLDSSIQSDLETVLESSIILNYRGVLSPKRAEREVRAIQILRKEGFCNAYEPLGFFVYSLPDRLSKDDNAFAGAALMKIESDIRIDEFVFALMSDIIYKSIQEGTLKYDYSQHAFIADNFSVSSFFREFKDEYSDIFYNLGKSIGSYYSEFHRNGHLRGYLNAWFGNEIVNPDGSLSLIDLDFSIMQPKFSKEDVKFLQKLEYSQARGAFSGEFESMFLHCFALVGYYLGKGFDEGYYNAKTLININKNVVEKAIDNIVNYSNKIFYGESK